MSSMTVGLVGNPNCGKSTVFNALTGRQQRVGNWPGVTVERKSGFFQCQEKTIEVVDLPGIYSLTRVSEDSSIDESIACDYILKGHSNVIVNILDASQLERSLYLTLQLLEMRVPVILALNMMDMARSKKIKILVEKFSQELNCPVVMLEANKNKGIRELKKIISSIDLRPSQNHFITHYPDFILNTANEMARDMPPQAGLENQWLALRLLEGDIFARQFVPSSLLEKIPDYQKNIHSVLGEDSDILLADARYTFIHDFLSHCVITSTEQQTTVTAFIDRFILHRVLGIPIFLGVMYCMFLFSINIGGAFQDFFDISSHTIFVEGAAHGLAQLHAPSWLIALLANGVGKGINTTVTFIPVMGTLFLFLAFLEDSGYMTRAAFVIDRLMRVLGLPGKSFVPLIVGFGCNVPAVMAARTLENKRDRILTVMMSPFMSCGARLAIYAVFVAAFFPVGGQNIVFMLYLIGIAAAMLTGLLLRKTVLQGISAPLLMELPAYHLPRMRTLGRHAWRRLKGFVWRAGKLIVPICVLLGILGNGGDAHSLLATLGRTLTPIFSPMGIHQENWPATVGLLTGVLAKEVVIGTLNALYSQVGHLASVSQGVYGVMAQQFDGQVGAIAYLLFILLYVPCVSTTAAMWNEMGRGWTVFSVCWTTGVAYGAAVVFYQLATWFQHPVMSLVWVLSIISIFLVVICGMRMYASRDKIKNLMRDYYEPA
jgi:ferrous iron transport protein B